MAEPVAISAAELANHGPMDIVDAPMSSPQPTATEPNPVASDAGIIPAPAVSPERTSSIPAPGAGGASVFDRLYSQRKTPSRIPAPSTTVRLTPRQQRKAATQQRSRKVTPGMSKATGSRSQNPRLPAAKQSTSVFDRLYKTQTAASKSWAPNRAETRKTTSRMQARKYASVDDSIKVFTRLHITETESTKSKRLNETSLPAKTPEKPARRQIALSSAEKGRKGNYIFSPSMKPKTKLLCSSKYHPSAAHEEVPPISLGYSFFQSFCEYEAGALTAPKLATELIHAFFKKDFTPGRHWEIDSPVIKSQPNDTTFHVEMSATWDWKDIYSVATAKGIVRFFPDKDEVRVDNYSYYVAG